MSGDSTGWSCPIILELRIAEGTHVVAITWRLRNFRWNRGWTSSCHLPMRIRACGSRLGRGKFRKQWLTVRRDAVLHTKFVAGLFDDPFCRSLGTPRRLRTRPSIKNWRCRRPMNPSCCSRIRIICCLWIGRSTSEWPWLGRTPANCTLAGTAINPAAV